IPICWSIAYFNGRAIRAIVSSAGIDEKIWPLFLMGFILGALAFLGLGLHRLKTFIHEAKHAVVVLLTGNNLKNFEVGKHEGLVEYEVFKDRLHLEPFVILAPYFLPVLSFPVLIAAILTEPRYTPPFVFLMGVTLSIDLVTAHLEIHGHQSDLRRIWGGFIATRAFILGFKLMWASVCLLWVIAGRESYLFALAEALRYLELVTLGPA
ncbi:MAG: M50 family metallopeptidase, partial [Deltaproteobacteria bacterium]|nr:M50 family metallopeptidase [Deltaproteobacteria bacterium]